MRPEVRRDRARYNGLTPSQFGEMVGLSEDSVRDLITAGWFRWTTDAHGRRVPECEDTRKVGAEHPRYKIHPSAVTRWFEERAVTAA